jgi:hypothetical protein
LASLEKIPITNMSITFVESHYPRSLLAHLREVHGFIVEETTPEIYTVKGNTYEE